MSTYKNIVYGKDARAKLAAGADKLAKATVSTLGPRSRNVAVNQQYPAPEILHDGVSVAKQVRLKDPFEDMGAVLLSEAASKTNDLAGDGTTTATLIANTLVQEGFKLIEGGIQDNVITGRVNPMFLRDELLKYIDLITALLDKRAVQITEKKDYQKIAAVSSSSEELGKLVADAIEKVGKDGIIMVEAGTTFESTLDVQEGFEFDNGFLSPYFVTDPDRMITQYEDGYILLTDYLVADPQLLVPIIEKVMADNNKPLLVVADDVVGPALQAMALTKLDKRTNARLVAVVAPEFAERRKEVLEDMAILTGATVISRDLGKNLRDVEIKDLGRFRSLRVTQTHTTISPKFPDSEEIAERVKAIKEQIDHEENQLRAERLKVRLSKLSSSVATINIGGGTSQEIKEKRLRAIDAVYATKAALAEGIVPGGGVVLREIAQEIFADVPMNKDIANIVEKALNAPFETILANAGEDVTKVTELMKVLPDQVKNVGYDVVAKKTGDMLHMGILDPVKVTKLAIRHAFSVAATMLTNECLISDDYEADSSIQKIRVV